MDDLKLSTEVQMSKKPSVHHNAHEKHTQNYSELTIKADDKNRQLHMDVSAVTEKIPFMEARVGIGVGAKRTYSSAQLSHTEREPDQSLMDVIDNKKRKTNAPKTIQEELEDPQPESAVKNWRKKQKSTSKKVPVLKSGINDEWRSKSSFPRMSLDAKGKPNWKTIKRESIKLKKQRKEKKGTNYDVILEAKRLWEQVRRDDCSPEKKAVLIVSLHNLTKEHINKIVFAHDTSRIVQWLLKLGSPAVRSSICESLLPVLIEMFQKRFSSHCVRHIFKYGDKNSVRNVIKCLGRNVMKLMTSNVSAPLVEHAYSQHASTDEKKAMEQEFFGNSWRLHVCTGGPEVKTLEELCTHQSSEIKKSVLQDTKENIIKVINKENLSSSLLHSVIKQFLSVCSPQDRDEVLLLLTPSIMELVKTKAGSRVSMQCCWFTPKKNKKTIVRQLKGNVMNVCFMEDGFWLILALLDAVDDTVLLKKIIISEILDNATEIIKKESGRKVILYLVRHRDKTYFHPKDIAMLEQGDKSETVLKNPELRRSQILLTVIESLLQSIAIDTNVWIQDASIAMVTLAVLKTGQGAHLKTALSAVAKYVCSDARIQNAPLIEHAGLNLVLKKLIKLDELRQDPGEMFSFLLASTLDEAIIKQWIKCTRGSFILIGILETKKEDSTVELLKKINKESRQLISAAEHTGTRILDKVLTSFEGQGTTSSSEII